jgi:hypothetical protein
MGYVVFLLVLFIEPALLSVGTGVPYWAAWDGAFLHAFLAGALVAVSQETLGFFRRS